MNKLINRKDYVKTKKIRIKIVNNYVMIKILMRMKVGIIMIKKKTLLVAV